MSTILRTSRGSVFKSLLFIKSSHRFIYTYKMAEKSADYSSTNGIESKTPFLIGVAGGTASGKVNLTLWVKNIDFLQTNSNYVTYLIGIWSKLIGNNSFAQVAIDFVTISIYL